MRVSSSFSRHTDWIVWPPAYLSSPSTLPHPRASRSKWPIVLWRRNTLPESQALSPPIKWYAPSRSTASIWEPASTKSDQRENMPWPCSTASLTTHFQTRRLSTANLEPEGRTRFAFTYRYHTWLLDWTFSRLLDRLTDCAVQFICSVMTISKCWLTDFVLFF